MLHVVARVGICLPEIVRHLSVTPRAPWLHLPSAADAIRAKFGLNEFPWVILRMGTPSPRQGSQPLKSPAVSTSSHWLGAAFKAEFCA